MKNKILLLCISSVLVLSSCGTSSYYAGGYQDGIYYRPDNSLTLAKTAEDKKLSDLSAQTKDRNQSRYSKNIVDTLYLDEKGVAVVDLEPDKSYLVVIDEETYEDRFKRFNDDSYCFTINFNWDVPYYSYWYNPWYYPSWHRHHYFGFYNPWYGSYFGWGYYDPWYYGYNYGFSPMFGWGYYDPWYYGNFYNPYFNPYYPYHPYNPYYPYYPYYSNSLNQNYPSSSLADSYTGKRDSAPVNRRPDNSLVSNDRGIASNDNSNYRRVPGYTQTRGEKSTFDRVTDRGNYDRTDRTGGTSNSQAATSERRTLSSSGTESSFNRQNDRNIKSGGRDNSSVNSGSSSSYRRSTPPSQGTSVNRAGSSDRSSSSSSNYSTGSDRRSSGNAAVNSYNRRNTNEDYSSGSSSSYSRSSSSSNSSSSNSSSSSYSRSSSGSTSSGSSYSGGSSTSSSSGGTSGSRR